MAVGESGLGVRESAIDLRNGPATRSKVCRRGHTTDVASRAEGDLQQVSPVQQGAEHARDGSVRLTFGALKLLLLRELASGPSHAGSATSAISGPAQFGQA